MMAVPMVSLCAWCHPGVTSVDGVRVTHGICERHAAEMRAEVERLRPVAVRSRSGAAVGGSFFCAYGVGKTATCQGGSVSTGNIREAGA
jgi:hypothetical protein